MNEIVLNLTCLSSILNGKHMSSCQSTHKSSVITYLKKICRVFNVTVWLVRGLCKSFWKGLPNHLTSEYCTVPRRNTGKETISLLLMLFFCVLFFFKSIWLEARVYVISLGHSQEATEFKLIHNWAEKLNKEEIKNKPNKILSTCMSCGFL